MLIKNLPKSIKELVFKRQIEQGNQPNGELDLSLGKKQGNFYWEQTPEIWGFWWQINNGNYKPFFEKYGGVILCTSVEQGVKIIEYFKSIGVDTKHYKSHGLKIYYGIVDNDFGYFASDYVIRHNIPVFTLDELGVETSHQLGWQGENTKHVEVTETDKDLIVSLKMQTTPYPELPEINFEGIEMEVSNHGVKWQKAKVLGKINSKFLTKDLAYWNHARPIQQKVKVTKEQIAKAFNTSVELLEIE